MDAYRHLQNFLTQDEVERFYNLIQSHDGLFLETQGRAGLGPRYRVIDGDQIRQHISDIADLGEDRVRPVAEQVFGQRIQLLGSSRRSMRVQQYERKFHGFRWHRDAHDYVALLALKNTNQGQTQIISPGWSRILKYLLYPLYAVPQVFSLAPYLQITLAAGDLLLLRGTRVLHRAVTLDEEGERTLIVFTYDAFGKRPNPFRDKIARFLNY